MKKIFLLLSLLHIISCGPSMDAKEICRCYDEVYQSPKDEATEKMKECLDMFNRYLEKHKQNGSYDEFIEEYNKCR